MKKDIFSSIITTLIATTVYGIIIYFIEKGNFNTADYIGIIVYAIVMFISNLFIVQKYKK